jgi:hypothetical protein
MALKGANSSLMRVAGAKPTCRELANVSRLARDVQDGQRQFIGKSSYQFHHAALKNLDHNLSICSLLQKDLHGQQRS